MLNTAAVFVQCDTSKREIYVKCVISMEQSVTNFCFSLSTLLVIDRVVANEAIEWSITKKWQPVFQHQCQEIEIHSELPLQEITIEYHGKISGWDNIIEEKRIALSSYSAWFISNTSLPLKYQFLLLDMGNYFVINGQYDSSRDIWNYGDEIHDTGNIIAFKKGHYHAICVDKFTVYYANPDTKRYADGYAHCYKHIMDYYSMMFFEKPMTKLDLVCLDIEHGSDAYFRNELIVIGRNAKPFKDQETLEKDIIPLLAHELGHHWFMGADTSSWEDWLNETGAEWATLLYLLSIGKHQWVTDRMSFLKEIYIDTPVIRSPDGKRPAEGVHYRGVMLFYELYCRYGVETIQEILLTLSKLKEVTTHHLIAELKKNVGDTIAGKIEQGLTAKDYAVLFHG